MLHNTKCYSNIKAVINEFCTYCNITFFFGESFFVIQ